MAVLVAVWVAGWAAGWGRGAGSVVSASGGSRAVVAAELIASLQASGAVVHVPLEVRERPGAGLGVFVAAAVGAGASLVSLPASLMMGAGDGKPHAGGKRYRGEVALVVELAREAAHPSSDEVRLYLATLPKECPPNLVHRPAADLALASASLHAWKVELIRDSLAAVERELPAVPEAARQWAVCMVLSRALQHEGLGPAMMPFLDLLNHGDAARHDSYADRAVIVAARPLAAGDELSFTYTRSPSKARLLTSFGFSAGAPAASLAATDLPSRDPAWLARQGCPETAPRTDLHLDSDGRLSESSMREALRCIRLRLYSPAEAALALRLGHLDAAWGGAAGGDDAANIAALLAKDARVVMNTGAMCAGAQEGAAAQAGLFEAASPDLAAAVREETVALADCAALLEAAHHALAAATGSRGAGAGKE